MKILLLGATGKLGAAIKDIFGDAHEVIGKGSKDFDAANFESVGSLINEHRPQALINAAAFLGTHACETEPAKALRINAEYPKFLAERCVREDIVLAHISTDAVFDGRKGEAYAESDTPRPLNMYAYTKYGGDCFVAASAKRHYLFRLPILFGQTTKDDQIVERLLAQAASGRDSISVSGDMFCSPTYARDAAAEIRRIMESQPPFGLYHIGNAGRASLHDLMTQIVADLGLRVRVEKVAHKTFRLADKRSLDTTLRSEKLPPLRPWREAVKDYCTRLAASAPPALPVRGAR